HSNRIYPEEYLFSPLFHLPGTSEPLSFSLYIDSLSVLWLIILSFFSLVLNIFRLINKRNLHQQIRNLAAMQLAQSGLATLYLSGSLVTSLIGWAVALAAIILSITDHKKASSKNDGMGFMILTLSVFFLLSSIFMIYGISGRLSFANSSTHLKTLLASLMTDQSRNIAQNILNMSGFCLILGVLPGLGLAPFTSWLKDTRETNPVNTLYIFLVIMPAGTIILQRYTWFFSLTPKLQFIISAISIISLGLAWIACYSQKGGKLTLPWLAISGTSLLTLSFATQSVEATNHTLLSIYPGFLLFGIGRLLSIEHGKAFGRIIQTTGLIVIILSTIALVIIDPSNTDCRWFLPLIVLGFLIPAYLVYRHSATPQTDSGSLPSSLGWTAFSFFGMSNLLKYAIAWPVQQVAEGFWTIETFYNQFWQYGLGRLIKSWSKYLWLFDCWFVEGATKWLKKTESKYDKVSPDERNDRL
ncbi:hypothetical protein K8T06_00650, partial [bacterium]|nr:hypothetical protein [bacterium]